MSRFKGKPKVRTLIKDGEMNQAKYDELAEEYLVKVAGRPARNRKERRQLKKKAKGLEVKASYKVKVTPSYKVVKPTDPEFVKDEDMICP